MLATTSSAERQESSVHGAPIYNAPVIEAQNITKRFGTVEVLKGITMQAKQSDVITIIGSSGSGKSTFLRCLNLLEIPNGGTLTYRGETLHFGARTSDRVWRKQVAALRSQLGMVFQRFNLWEHRTVLENVMEGPRFVLGVSKAEASETAREYLAKVGLTGKEEFYPAHLSGGQQQRVAIARALAMGPQAILFDEPTSALDPELVGEVLKVMRQLAADGCTMIIVTHEMAFARDVATRMMFLQDGTVEAQGTPDELLGELGPKRIKQFLSGGADTDR